MLVPATSTMETVTQKKSAPSYAVAGAATDIAIYPVTPHSACGTGEIAASLLAPTEPTHAAAQAEQTIPARTPMPVNRAIVVRVAAASAALLHPAMGYRVVARQTA